MQYQEKIVRRFSRYMKRLLYSVRKPCKHTLPVFIMGCGRSGTTMLMNIFHRDHRTESLNENSPKIAENFMLISDRVTKAISASKAPVLVMKPILNSFDALYLLENHDNSKVIWVLRDYKDMIASSIKKFGTTVSDFMKDLILHGKGHNWLSRGVPMETREIISAIDVSDFTPYDWMALVWWSVNRTIILDRLYDLDRFLLLQYETLVQNPGALLETVYAFIGMEYRNKAAKYVHPASVGKGSAIQLHIQVEHLCHDLAEAIFRLPRTVKPQQ